MKKIADKDLGINCDFVATGETDSEVARKAMEHIRESHPDEAARVKAVIRSKIKEEAPAKA